MTLKTLSDQVMEFAAEEHTHLQAFIDKIKQDTSATVGILTAVYFNLIITTIRSDPACYLNLVDLQKLLAQTWTISQKEQTDAQRSTAPKTH